MEKNTKEPKTIEIKSVKTKKDETPELKNKIKELKDLVDAKDKQIENLTNSLEEVEAELEQEIDDSEALAITVQELTIQQEKKTEVPTVLSKEILLDMVQQILGLSFDDKLLDKCLVFIRDYGKEKFVDKVIFLLSLKQLIK